MFESISIPAPISLVVRIMLAVWFFLLPPWLLIAPLSGMAFEGGFTAEAYVLVWSVWTYPIWVAISFFRRRKNAYLVFLPGLTLLGIALSELLHNPY
jgi:hypothetical protein